MNTDFKYFHWAIPKADCELYGLYDVFDNQLLLLTYDFEVAWQLKNFIKSKIILEIIDFSDNVKNLLNIIDNSVIERWGLESPPPLLFQDVRTLSKVYTEQENYRDRFLIKYCKILETQTKLDYFKQDLQQQIFFFHYCLYQAINFYKFDRNGLFFQHLLSAAELGESYQDVFNRFLNISNLIDLDVLHFLRHEGLLYE